MKPLRIAMIGTRGVPATVGGVERAVEELSARLAEAGHEVTVYCRRSYSASGERTHRGIRTRYVPALNTKHFEAISHSLLATLDAVFRRYDIVHYHALGPSLCAPLARLAGLRVVTTVHALDFRGGKWGRIARIVLRVGAWTSARVPHRTVVVSRELQSYFAAQYGSQATYVPNGVETPPEGCRPSFEERREHGHFLFLGRLVPEKAVHTLIEAYRQIDTEIPLVIAGPPSHTEDYERRLLDLAQGDRRITLVGPVYNEAKVELVRLTYAFCQPSTHEGLPIALLEMMSEGVCPVVSDIPEHLEVVSGEHGDPVAILFRADDVSSLRDALETAVARPDIVAERGTAARELVAGRYSWDDVAARIETVYLEARSSPRMRPPRLRRAS